MNEAKAAPTFKLIGVNKIPAIQVQVEHYEHVVTGATHVHIAADNTENVFMVAFRTMPETSNGVAHILEHTALCGSEKYPTRDPFFSMLRRSLNSFMNAFTSCDWTAYPFASPNKKDFNNLLGVYLDAAFFPRLSELDFKQEGHRVDFAEQGNKESDLIFKGVVFNEMKGAMSPPARVLGQAMQTALCPDTTYEINSGGEPVDIPKLTYQGFKDFHKTHYHPSNAIFMTYGDTPAASHQEKFESEVLHRFEKSDKSFSVPNVKRFKEPKNVHIKYAFDEEDTSKRTYIQMGWLLGNTTNSYENLKTLFLYMSLLGDSSSPLSAVLESTDLGTAPKCGFDPDNKETMFTIGLQGSEVKNAEAVEKLILNTLEKVAKDGLSKERTEALLDQLEVSVRSLEAGGYPLGLSMMLGMMNSAIHGGDLLNSLDITPVLNKLREEASKPGFVQNLVKEMLLNNTHRVTIIAEPDTTLSKAKNTNEAKVLADMKAKMSDAELDAVIKQAKNLDERQDEVEDLSILPTVTMEDISKNVTYPNAIDKTENGEKGTAYSAGTNGLVSQRLVISLPKLTERQVRLLPYYTNLVTEIAVGDKDYLEVGEWQTSICSTYSASSSIRNILGNTNTVNAFVTFKSSGLERHASKMVDMMLETMNNVSFHEHSRLKDLVGQIKLGKENSITGSGHIMAAAAASSGMSASGSISFKTGGLAGVKFVKELYKSLETEAGLESFSNELSEIHALIKKSKHEVMAIAETEKLDDVLSKLTGTLSKLDVDASLEGFVADKVDESVNDMWVTNTQVNFCAKAYKTVSSTHADAPALSVLGQYMRDNFLHTAIREKGGAYGGGASFNADNGTFGFSSYRDPRISGTLTDFDASIEWMKTHEHDQEKVKESIFGIIGSIDAPNTPMKDAATTYSGCLHGRTGDVRRDYRARLLAVTADDLVRVVTKYLVPEKASTAVITSAEGLKNEGDLGLRVINL